MKLRIVIMLAFVMVMTNCFSQTIVHDEQKSKIWTSMEAGKWDFSPGMYYYLLHKKYSGATGKWNWKKFRLDVKFRLDKSNVGQIGPVRTAAAATQNVKNKSAIKEKERIYEPYKEDLQKQADRMVDLAYPAYKDEFNRMQKVISEGLLICMNRSNGAMKRQVDEISRQNEIVCENISYIHKTGIDSQLENSRRQKAYEEAKKEMAKLVNRTVHLTALAVSLYR